MTRYFLFSFDGSGWRELHESEIDEASGGDGSIVQVTSKSEYYHILEVDQYYCSGGELILTIAPQPLERALATYGALLKADYELERRSLCLG